jgi:hypothetical protein
MTRCPSVFPGLVRVRVALMSLRCLAILSCGLLAASFMILRSILDLSMFVPYDSTDCPIFVRASRLHCKPEPITQIFRLFALVGVNGALLRKAAPRSPIAQCTMLPAYIANRTLPSAQAFRCNGACLGGPCSTATATDWSTRSRRSASTALTIRIREV